MGELARIETQQLALPEIIHYAEVFVKSGFFSDTRDAAQAAVKIMAGQEIGLQPMAAMMGIYIISGKVGMGANVMAGQIKGSGKYDYKVVTLTTEKCQIDFYEGKTKIGESVFTVADAKLASTKNMEKFPRNMLFARAMSNGARWFCPDVFNGTTPYTAEELGGDGPAEELPQDCIEGEVVQQEEKPVDPEAGKRTKMVDAIFATWELRADFQMWIRRRNSIKSQAGNTWTEELDALDAEPSVRLWLDNVPLATLRAYGKHNADRAKAERDAQVEQEREVDYA